EERVLDLPARLRDRVQVAEREGLAGQRDVDDLLRERAVELGPLELGAARVERGFEPAAQAVQGDATLAVADAAQRLGKLALAAQVAHAHVLERRRRRAGLDRGQRLALVLLPVHGGDCIAHRFLLSRRVDRAWSGPGSRGCEESAG